MQNKDKDIDSKKLKGLTCSVFSFNSALSLPGLVRNSPTPV